MSLDNLELNPDVEVYKPPLEYVTHEQLMLQLEREANRKLKAEIRHRKKLGLKKIMMGEITVIYKPWPHDSNL